MQEPGNSISRMHDVKLEGPESGHVALKMTGISHFSFLETWNYLFWRIFGRARILKWSETWASEVEWRPFVKGGH